MCGSFQVDELAAAGQAHVEGGYPKHEEADSNDWRNDMRGRTGVAHSRAQ